MAAKTARTKKVKAEATPHEDGPPPVVVPLTSDGAPPVIPPEQTQADQKAAANAREKAEEDAAEALKAQARVAEAKRKDEEKRSVRVRAIRRGQYPADGRIRNPGDVFDYVLLKDKKGKLEEKLPSWMVDVAGKIESREPGEQANPEPEPLVLEVRGTGANATVTQGRTAAGGRSVL
jgi:hypothetical protein